jgi:hypothetical protein
MPASETRGRVWALLNASACSTETPRVALVSPRGGRGAKWIVVTAAQAVACPPNAGGEAARA